VSGIPDGFYLSQVQLNGADVTNKPFQFSAIGADNLNVFLQAGASRVTGIVHDAAGKPMSDADVALFPYQQPEQFSRIVVGRSDSNGQFRFSGLAPGTYQLFAWDGIEAYGHFDQELRTRSESRSLRVVVAVGQTVDVELRGIRIADLR
jgi:protocatechuate 3,4-dioxygenase beta subunit